jgi:zinc transport system substrate-binding protein
MRALHPALLLILVLIQHPAMATKPTADKLDIVVTIRPLYSLVAHLTNGIVEPKLLLRQQADAHHVYLRPSQRRMLADADLIIRISHQLSPFLDSIAAQQAHSRLVSASDAPGITILPRRTSDEQAQHTEHHGHGPGDDEDPHIWLSSANASAISRHIAANLKESLPEHGESIDANLAALLTRIDDTERQIKQAFSQGKVSYIAQHDAFQYYDNEHGIRFVAAVTFDEEAGASLRHLRELGKLITRQQVNCLAYQRPRQNMVDTLADRYHLTTIELDPLGLDASSDRDAWFEIMHSLRLGFQACL